MNAKIIFLLSFLAAFSSHAEEASVSSQPMQGQGWSTSGGRTVGYSSTVVTGEVGWPGLTVGVLHGVTSRVDFGARFSFNYGYEGMVDSVLPGVKLQGVFRTCLLESRKLSLAFEFAPGPLFYFPRNYTAAGLALPVALTGGFAVTSAVQLHAGLEMPLWVAFGNDARLMIPILFAGGVDYFLDRNLAVTFNVKMGPTIDTFTYYDPIYRVYYTAGAHFTLNALIGVAYRF